MHLNIRAIGIVLLVLIAQGCGEKKFIKNPVDELVRDMPTKRVFSVILNDMDVTGTFFHVYQHQYKIIEESDAGKPTERLTEWYPVDEKYFKSHTNDMGMEIVSRGEDGKLNKSVSPPGYNNYVGNEKYGHWVNQGGNSFWAFYGQYAFMSSMFNLMGYPVRRSYYNNYRGSYYGRRSYYGPMVGGSRYYGTNSKYTSSTRPNSSWSRNNSSFKQRVSGRTSRSTSRYGRSSRSRGGGFGK